MDLALNRRAAALARAMADEAAVLGIASRRLPGGTRVVDCGVEVEGGLEAGRRLALVCLGGLGTVDFTSVDLGGLWLPAVSVVVDHAVAACLGSQYAGWAINPPGYFALGSGPARALCRVERPLFDRIGYAESGDTGALVLETRTLPGEEVAGFVAERCGIALDGLTVLVAPTASLAGSVQIAARSVETGLHKMVELGFDVRTVRGGAGVCPLAPVAESDVRAIGWTNDCILYGARAYFAVRASDDEIRALAERLPASASRDYGRPFAE
ncbi:MAG TPA: methenyltetrahydromethanopterin cyclohydrolase, partial [Methylomirabilota bacterium]|nr:methenyltetrahydromethanopterin cyclohydrolase [Methylomirabilota bacterium]